jgi:sphingosine kinase
MDLTELDLEYQPDQKVFMFLMMSWAIISDSDINSEVIRWIGSPRFTIWGVYRIISLRHYPGSLTYNGIRQESNLPNSKEEEFKQCAHAQENFKFLSIYNCPWIGTTFHAAPLSKVDDGTNDIMLMDSNKSRF